MSKYIIIDHGYTATLGERQEDGSYKTLDLSEKGALVRLLEEIANDGSVREAGVNIEPSSPRTLEQRQAALEAVDYVFDTSDSADDICVHRDIHHKDGDFYVCGAYTRTEAIELAEEHYNGSL